jgi:phenylacetate-coenzyme A ligase PaaK-like adenylate-forming protein
MQEVRLPTPKIRARLAVHGEVPSEAEWNPIEAALYTPHPFTAGPAEAAALRFAAIHTSFTYHVEHNAFYRRYCETAGFLPGDLRGPDDLPHIPLVPEHLFKGCQGPEQFIAWLTSISSDELGWPAPETLGGSYDEQIAALYRDHGIRVRSTSGSSGVPSFLPRDPITRRRSAHWKILTYFAMYPEVLDLSELLSVTLWPLDFSWADLIVPQERVYALLDKKLGLEMVIRAMTTTEPRGILDRLLGRGRVGKGVALLESLAAQLQDLSALGTPGILWTPPFLLYSLACFVRERGLRLKLGEHWRIELGGGWKLLYEPSISEPKLRELSSQTFDVRAGQIHDIYGSTECLGLIGLSCEGGYKHVPHTVLHPLVLNEGMEPAGDGEWGRFAFLNPLVQAYPGFIVTGDRVRLLSRCPACDRNGPVLDPEISRMPGAEDRGCANIVRQIITERLTA